MESNAISSISNSIPSSSAIACAISASIPTILSPSWNSYGGNSALVAITSLPPAASFDSAAVLSAAVDSSFAAAVVSAAAAAVVSFAEPPHAVKDAAIRAAIVSAITLFFIMFSPLACLCILLCLLPLWWESCLFYYNAFFLFSKSKFIHRVYGVYATLYIILLSESCLYQVFGKNGSGNCAYASRNRCKFSRFFL